MAGTVTTTEPVRVGAYALALDQAVRPQAVTLIAFQDGSDEPFTVVDWLPYEGRADALWRSLVDRGIPAHVAGQLVMKLARSGPSH